MLIVLGFIYEYILLPGGFALLLCSGDSRSSDLVINSSDICQYNMFLCIRDSCEYQTLHSYFP